ncbi:MAG: hypothetical protein ABSA46_15055 [Thermodesulfovibrionales bacterium]|jgi:hypothetical protein
MTLLEKIDWWQVFSVMVGVILGGLITWGVSRYYYQKGSADLGKAASHLSTQTDKLFSKTKELEGETKVIHNLNTITLNGMSNAGLADLYRDKDGNIIGLNGTARLTGWYRRLRSDPPYRCNWTHREVACC